MHAPVLLFLSNLFSSDMVIIVFVALLLFGGEKLPEIARGLGKGIRDFKDASEGVKREINNQINSFEEKREEKRLDEAAVVHQEAAQNQLPESTVSASTTTPLIRPVENTIPVSDSHFSISVNHEVENNEPVHTEQVNENHVAVVHEDVAATAEPVKNSSNNIKI
jgi:sec-independent protein translocase protein TatA